MGFADSFKKVIGLTDIGDDEIVTEQELSAEKEKIVKESRRERERETPRDRGFIPAYKEMPVEVKPIKASTEKRFSVTNTNSLKLILIEPKGFDECPKLVDSLKARKPVIINLEKLETDVARKIFDFLSGATYALDGKVQKIANNIFIFTPDNVSVAASQVSTIENRNSWR